MVTQYLREGGGTSFLPRSSGRDGPHARLPEGATVVLIDYANFFPPGSGDPSDSALRHEFLRLLRAILGETPETEWVLIRLYGGWMVGGSLTSVGSRVSQVVHLADPFPLPNAAGDLVHGEVELAVNMAAVPGVIMGETYRRRQGPARLQLANAPLPEGCTTSVEDCPFRTLGLITRRPDRACPISACEVTPRAAFVVHEQKMVDVMLASDLLYFSRDSTASHVVLTTCDSDLLPALCYGAQVAEMPVSLIPLSHCWAEANIALLEEMGVSVNQIGGEDESR